jgi:hypothetical protein
MSSFNQVILSRKGFDLSYGGDFSLFDLETGRFIVLPIPVVEIGSYPGNCVAYDDIKIESNYLSGISANSLKELVCHESTHYPRRTKETVSSHYAHFDPWLGHCPWLRSDYDHHLGAFGQVGGAQTILKKRDVSKGSLFLFFSRFRPVGVNLIHGSKFNDIDISRDNLKKGIAFIYGWFKVGEVIEKYVDINSKLSERDARDLTQRHPHATKRYFEDPTRKNNAIYIADRYLFDNSKEHSGCGYFRKLSENLLLTATEPAQKSFHHWLPSRWKMPPGLSQRTSRIYPNDWLGDNLMIHNGNGQEFVFSGSEEFYQWFNDRLFPELSD